MAGSLQERQTVVDSDGWFVQIEVLQDAEIIVYKHCAESAKERVFMTSTLKLV